MQKWLHIAGIAGKATSSVAKMYQDLGYFVTGSDNQCLPPATDLLDKNNIPYVDGFNYQHLTKQFWEQKLSKELAVGDVPDRTVFVSTLTPQNKEYLFAKNKRIKIQTFAQALGEDLVKPDSIVSVGTAGKTTTTGLLIHILKGLEFDPSYMVGAELADGSESIYVGASDWSVLEGDEYYGIAIEPHSKFFEYKPKYLLLNKLDWDHADVFPTEEAYMDNFKKLVSNLPADGLLIANCADPNILAVAKHANCQVRFFAATAEVSELISDDGKKLYWHLNQLENETFEAVSYEPTPFKLRFQTKLLGDYNRQNVLGVIALLYELFAQQIDWQHVAQLIGDFRGMKKRMELVYENEKMQVFDELGGPPVKMRNALGAAIAAKTDQKLIVVYEPNSGSRVREMLQSFVGNFDGVDTLIMPKLASPDQKLLTTEQIVEEVGQKMGAGEVLCLDDQQTLKHLQKAYEQDHKLIVVFVSAYRLTGLMREFIESIE